MFMHQVARPEDSKKIEFILLLSTEISSQATCLLMRIAS